MKAEAIVSYYKLLGHYDLKKMIERDSRIDGTSTVKVENGILKTKSGSINERAYIFEKLYVPGASWVEIEFMAKSVSGKGNFTVDVFDNPNFNSDSAQDNQNINDKDWKFYRFRSPSEAGLNYARLLFGQWKNTVGETWFKSIVIKGYNLNPHPDIRFAAIKGSKLQWKLNDEFDAYANEGVIGAMLKTDYIEIEYSPFRTWAKPLYSATVLRDGNPTNIMATVGTSPTAPDRYCRIYLVNPGTGDKIMPNTIASDITIFFEAKSR